MSYYDILNKQNLTLPEFDTFESVPSTPLMIEDDLEESDDSEGEFCEIDNDNNVYFNKNNKDKFLNLFELARDVENLEKIADDESIYDEDDDFIINSLFMSDSLKLLLNAKSDKKSQSNNDLNTYPDISKNSKESEL
ncbi:22135_t:CDS:2 [Entrophospora sp. SA101]|nr:22135_t:CDS:2 [Entrophospora sp. SA101]